MINKMKHTVAVVLSLIVIFSSSVFFADEYNSEYVENSKYWNTETNFDACLSINGLQNNSSIYGNLKYKIDKDNNYIYLYFDLNNVNATDSDSVQLYINIKNSYRNSLDLNISNDYSDSSFNVVSNESFSAKFQRYKLYTAIKVNNNNDLKEINYLSFAIQIDTNYYYFNETLQFISSAYVEQTSTSSTGDTLNSNNTKENKKSSSASSKKESTTKYSAPTTNSTGTQSINSSANSNSSSKYSSSSSSNTETTTNLGTNAEEQTSVTPLSSGQLTGNEVTTKLSNTAKIGITIGSVLIIFGVVSAVCYFVKSFKTKEIISEKSSNTDKSN